MGDNPILSDSNEVQNEESNTQIGNENKCDICGIIFQTPKKLQNHFNHVHNSREKITQCNICTKTYNKKTSLKYHIDSAHARKRFEKCESCGKTFSKAGYLKNHIHTVHEGHKDHKCQYCGKSFSQAGHLKKHIHTIH